MLNHVTSLLKIPGGFPFQLKKTQSCFKCVPYTPLTSRMVWMFVSHQNLHVEILTPQEIVLGSRTFGGAGLSHDGKALVIRIGAPENPLWSSAM